MNPTIIVEQQAIPSDGESHDQTTESPMATSPQIPCTLSNNSTGITPSISQHPPHHHHLTSPLSSNINIVNNPATSPMLLSNSLSSSTLTGNPAIPTSLSTHSINMLSSSLSTEKIANLHVNSTNLLDTDEIGHGIPTPECLPQSRKHSIVQSKLATPRLSSS